MTKSVFFDIGNVLVFFSFPKMIAQLQCCTGLDPESIQKSFFETDLRERYEKGHLSTSALYQIFLEKSSKPFSLREFERAFSDIFTLNNEILPIVEKLRAADVQLTLLSNISPSHFAFIDSTYGLTKLFDQKILSYELGIWKPEPKIFETALQMAKAKPDDCFYIDDIPHFVSSARSVGLPAEVFTNVANLEQELIKRHFLI